MRGDVVVLDCKNGETLVDPLRVGPISTSYQPHILEDVLTDLKTLVTVSPHLPIRSSPSPSTRAIYPETEATTPDCTCYGGSPQL